MLESTSPTGRPLSVGACATLACIWEATAAKPGNVHRGADFEDVTYADFLASAVAIGPVLDEMQSRGFGATLLRAVEATRAAVATNTNLGTLLLVVPLAEAAGSDVKSLVTSAAHVVRHTTSADTALVYEAIRVAKPGGLGRVEDADLGGPPPQQNVYDVMQLAAERDLIARQLVNGFAEVGFAVDSIEQLLGDGHSLHDAIVATAIKLQASWPDTLIERKLGVEVARQASDMADQVLAAGPPRSPAYEAALADFDFWLRCDGHRRNPGTTADLIAAALFVLLRCNRIKWPMSFYAGHRQE